MDSLRSTHGLALQDMITPLINYVEHTHSLHCFMLCGSL
jgi:hypothetical protein